MLTDVIVCWRNDTYEGKDFSTAEKRRQYALQYIRKNNNKGYLGYIDDKIIGWCNSNTKSECLKCASWTRFMDYVPLDDIHLGVKVKSIFCFVIAPEMKRKGIATSLLKRVCDDALQDEFDFIEAYPFKTLSCQSSNFGGYIKMYQKCGFCISLDTDNGIVMKKQLK